LFGKPISLTTRCTFILLLICCLSQVMAQKTRSISGTVIDSTRAAIPDVSVLLIAETDTLRTVTDQSGSFSMTGIGAAKFSIQASVVGFHRFSAEYAFTEKETHKHIGAITLKKSSLLLEEVVVKSKPNPMRFMQDTVEYNAAAFEVNEGDNVADLLKQFPGIEVDDNYHVKTAGKEMTKLRVNGTDFFTNNVSDFIAKLPAGIVSKIQVIDNFGDEANFTGIKLGEPSKMMNIVTKPGMGKGAFGDVSANAGTNDMIASSAQLNLWKENKQSSARVNFNTSNNGAGTSRAAGLGFTHNDRFGKHGRAGVVYNFAGNGNAFLREQVTESFNAAGQFINNSKSEGNSGGSNHGLNLTMSLHNKRTFLQGYLMGTYNVSDHENFSLNNQFGLLRQDINNRNSAINSSPGISGMFSFSRKLKNRNNSLSARTSFAVSGRSNDQNIRTNTLYYDKNTSLLLKDSLLNRDVNSTSNNQQLGFGFDYSHGLKPPKDSLGRQSLNFTYNGSFASAANMASTYVFDNVSNKAAFVDSLSTSFRSISFQQSFGINYNFNSQKMRYNVGLNASPNLITNRDTRTLQTTKNNTFNYSPGLNFSKTLTQGKILSFNYRGSNTNPTIYQLQPVQNMQNLQNIVVGNANLKPSFNHNMGSNFSYVHTKTGRTVQVGINASSVQREIVNHVMLLPDTLNSFKQITRYENVDGNYQINGNYFINIPIKKQSLSIRYQGSVGFSRRAVLFNHQKAFGEGLNYSQQIGGGLTKKKLTMNTSVAYLVTNNNNASSMLSFSEYQPIGIGQLTAPAFYRTSSIRALLDSDLRLKKFRLNASLGYTTNHSDATSNQPVRHTSDLNMRFSSRLTVKKTFFVNMGMTKRVNHGYALGNMDPLIMDVDLEKRFLKNNAMSIRVNANDLLGQGNNISRFVSGNTITDSRNNQPTRVLSLNLNYNLSNFGGKLFKVDPD
jgi:hypothetical protein